MLGKTMTSISILGSGAWGIALALTAYRAGNKTIMWGAFEKEIHDLKTNEEHTLLLPGIKIPKEIHLTNDLVIATKADIILFAVPAQALRQVLQKIRPHLNPDAYLIICAKGIELESGKLLSEVCEEEIPGSSPSAIGGPNFAREIALNLPATTTLASQYKNQSHWLASSLTHSCFHVCPSTDVKGVELAGAVKNVLAIACGLVTGTSLGENARASLITQGIAELMRLGLQKGCQLETFLGFSGIGDIVLTCTSQASRNMKLGYDLTSEKSLGKLKSEEGPLTEGAFTVTALLQMAQSMDISMPICEAVYRILYEDKLIEDEISSLLRHPLLIDLRNIQ
jgi:glycerol-3-phosphate dehydrogenase (NAD(P)+)